MLSRRLYLPSLKDVALLEVPELYFLIFHTFVCKFFSGKPCLDICLPSQVYRQMYGKLEILTGCLLKATSFKLGEYNLLPSILMS